MVFREKLHINILDKHPKIRYRHKHNRINAWFQKWYKLIIFLMIMLLTSIIVCFLIFYSQNNSNNKNFPLKIVAKSAFIYKTCDLIEYCTVSCESPDVFTVIVEINKLNLQTCRVLQELRLYLIKFENETINKGWLAGLSINLKKLTLKHTNLREIGGAAFSGKPFAELNYLSIQGSELNMLKKDSLSDMPLINTFELTFDNFRHLMIEENSFDAIQSSLETLQLIRCVKDSQTLQNITGIKGSQFNKLLVLDLRWNALKILSNGVFEKVRNVESIILSDNELSEIEYGAFHSTIKLKSLYLMNNAFVTLNENVFSGIYKDRLSLYIEGNFWNCDCNFGWFINFYENLYKKDNFTCWEREEGFIYYKDVTFCPNSTPLSTVTATSSRTTSEVITSNGPFTTTNKPSTKTNIVTSPTTRTSSSKSTNTFSTTTTTTTPSSKINSTPTTLTTNSPEITDIPVPAMVNIVCMEVSTVFESLSNQPPFRTIWIRNQTVQFDFYSYELSSYVVSIQGDLKSNYILWFDNGNIARRYCHKLMINPCSLWLGDLEAKKTYNFCLLTENKTGISPFDCTSFTVPPLPVGWHDEPWITNKYKSPIIIGICVCLIAVALITGTIVFYYIRQHPNLIKGNKRVIIVESKTTDAIVMPQTYTTPPSYAPPSLLSYSDGYLTPKVYDRVREYRLPTMKTITESSYPGMNRVRPSQIRRRAKSVQDSLEEDLYEPPPLPPNHPTLNAELHRICNK